MGAQGDVVRRVRALGDVGILKSYLLLVWSGWGIIRDRSENFAKMETSIQEDFGGIGMGCHRENLIKRLDHVLELLGHDKFRNIRDHGQVQLVKEKYSRLKRVLLEVDGVAVRILARTPLMLILFGLLTPSDAYRISLNLHVRSASPVPIISHPGKFAVDYFRRYIASNCHRCVPSTLPVASVRIPPKFT